MAKLSQKIQTAFFNPRNIPWIVLHKLETVIGYHILKSRSLPPETVNIYPSFRCNLKCEMCFERFAKAKNELDINDWLGIIDYIKRFHPRIHISGGEPFIFNDIIRMIEYIKNNNLYLHITTNGTFLSEYAEDLVRYKVNRIDISIDGPEEIHDKIRGVKGTFASILTGFERLRNFKRRYLPILKINSIINFNNPETMKEVVALAEQHGASMVQFIYPFYLNENEVVNHKKFLRSALNRNINYWCQASYFKPQSGDFYKIQAIFNEFSQKKIIIDVFPKFNLEQFKVFYNTPEDFNQVYKGKCLAMWHTATILPDGSIESCPDYVVGSIGRDNFLEIWNNQSMAGLRKSIRGNKFLSVCRACCFYYQ